MGGRAFFTKEEEEASSGAKLLGEQQGGREGHALEDGARERALLGGVHLGGDDEGEAIAGVGEEACAGAKYRERDTGNEK